MRSTIYINSLLLDRLNAVSVKHQISKDELISILITRIITDNSFSTRLFRPVQYQGSSPDIEWKRLHVNFEPVIYEKALDLRRNFKFTVSWFIAFAIKNYLDKLTYELTVPKSRECYKDNYDRNFVYIAKMCGKIQVFITMLGFPKEKYLRTLLN